ncbi:MAG: DUF1573 domain-containing protein [Chitinivibrionales bacterium]|nr:DUF1573 domain-containing protein [Chitinivibrionales bacterium]
MKINHCLAFPYLFYISDDATETNLQTIPPKERIRMNTKIGRSVLRQAAAVLVAVSNLLFAAPMIEFDQKEVDLGTIKEGAKDKIKHTFTMKNTGDEVLKITKVRPG